MTRCRILCLWVLLSACEMGRPLVDSWPPDVEGGQVCDAPKCILEDWPDPSGTPVQGSVRDVDLVVCGASSSSLGCQANLSDAGASAWMTEGGAPAPCGDTLDLKALRTLDEHPRLCETLEIDLDAAADRRVVLRGLFLRQVNLSLSSRMPLEVELRGAQFSDVRVRLVGPVSLHVVDPVSFGHVRVQGRAGALGAPTLELERIDTRDLQIGEVAAPFEGAVEIIRSVVSQWNISAAHVRLESSDMRRGSLDAQSLLALDTQTRTLVVGADEAHVAASNWQDVQFVRCGALTLLDSFAVRNYFTSCESAPLRIYNTSVFSGVVDGSVEADDAIFVGTLFGLRQKTDLASWDTAISDSNFCKYAQRHAVAGGSLQCVACEGGLRKRRSACTLEESGTSVDENDCTAWDDLEACEPPRPRPRPELKLE